MKVNQISLEQRLQRIKEGYASDPEFIISSIKSMARIPIVVYLNAFDSAIERLQEILCITEDEENEITYSQVATLIYEMRKQPEHKKIADEAIFLLTLPLQRCYEERKNIYERNTKNTT